MGGKVSDIKDPGQARGRAGRPGPARVLEPMRIAKAMARAGLSSRREAENWIAAGRVAVNGTVLTSPALVVGAADTITVDGEVLPSAQTPRLWRSPHREKCQKYW